MNMTERQGIPQKRTKPKCQGSMRPLEIGGIIAFAAMGAVLVLGFITRPPQYVARAAFVVDWNEMPLVLGDETVEKVRAKWRDKIISDTTALPRSEQLSDLIVSAGVFNSGDVPAATTQARKWMRITLVSQTNDCDCFVIQFRADDPTVAENVVKSVLHGRVARLNTDARIASGMAALRAKSNLDDIEAKQDEAKRNSDDDDSAEFELQHFQAGLSVFMNSGEALFGSAVKIIEEAHAEGHGGNHAVRVLFAALVFGGGIGLAGFWFWKFAAGKRNPALTTPKITTAPRPKLPPVNTPPIISQLSTSRPPQIIPPRFLNH
jgi:hypothetical protein